MSSFDNNKQVLLLSFLICMLLAVNGLACQSQLPKDDGEQQTENVSQHVAPIDSEATQETVALYKNLHDLQGIIFGHHESLAYGVHWANEPDRSDVKAVAGSYPGLYGWDVGHIGEEDNINGVSFENMKTWIRDAYQRGGIHAFAWHMRNPVTGEGSWDTTPAVHAILPGGSKHTR